MDGTNIALDTPPVLARSGAQGRPHRPCDSCRRRKTRCEIADPGADCVLCQFHKQSCTFLSDPPRKRRRRSNSETGEPAADSGASGSHADRGVASIRREMPVTDYADLRGPSLLKKTLGLQNHRHSALVGPTSIHNLQLCGYSPASEDIAVAPNKVLRLVSDYDSFLLHDDDGTRSHDQEIEDVDAIEALVAPHGQALIHLYFRIVHPTFPILHKRVFLEKYARTHREFSPPLLAAVYALALDWWAYSRDLSPFPKPDARKLERLAFKTMSIVTRRPKLSTIQASLLLHQRAEGESWAATTQLVGLAQTLGLHLDCTDWRIPTWEKGLRKRLAWAVYLQDKWGSLSHGRPSHISKSDWVVQALQEQDFPERAADEDDEDGSTEVEKGRVLFCEMIQLSTILSDILSAFYSVRADLDIRRDADNGVSWILQRAKPLQLRLREWYASLPHTLHLQEMTVRKLSSAGYLHLAYFATEIALHRRIIPLLHSEKSPEVVEVCRRAADERLHKALEFVGTLGPEYIQSFWYSASTYSFALIGSFISLLSSTSQTEDEAEGYRSKMAKYRWNLRLKSTNSEVLGRALDLMAFPVWLTEQTGGRSPLKCLSDVGAVSLEGDLRLLTGQDAWALEGASPWDAFVLESALGEDIQ